MKFDDGTFCGDKRILFKAFYLTVIVLFKMAIGRLPKTW